VIALGIPSSVLRNGFRCSFRSTTTRWCLEVRTAPPFVAGTDYTQPVAGQAVVAVYCGTSANCTGLIPTLYQSEIDVYVYYGFSDLNILGGGITITGSSRATTAW